MLKFALPGSAEPVKLPDLLRRLDVSLTLRRKLKRTPGSILLNGRPTLWSAVVQPGDVLSITWPEESQVEPLPIPLSIAYEDETLFVIDKPAGLLVHPVSGPPEPTLANGVVHYLRAGGGQAAFHPVHRLDRNTSGLILIAKNPYIQSLMGEADGKLSRSYLAVVSGHLSPHAGVIDAPIGRCPDSIITRMVRPDGQQALTHYATEEIIGPGSIVRLVLATGRTHQIRVHLAYIGHPIFGDDLYGGTRELINRQALHAARLTFTHPLSGQPIDVSSPLPPDIQSLLEKMRHSN